MSISMRVENTDKIIDPALLDEKEKKAYCESGARFVCTCRKNTKLIYALRKKTLALYPIHNEFARMHAPFCPLNERYGERSYADQLTEGKDGTLKADLIEDITKRPKMFYTPKREQIITKRCPREKEVAKEMPLLKLLIDINLETSYQQAQRLKINGKKHKGLGSFSKEVYRKAEGTEITNRGVFLAGKTLKEYGVAFGYARITGIKVRESAKAEGKDVLKTRITREYLDILNKRIEEKKHTYIRLCYESPDGTCWERAITAKALCHALETFMEMEGITVVGFTHPIIMGGLYSYEYENKNRQLSWLIDRLVIFRTNRYGVFSASKAEAAAYDTIMDYCNEEGGLYFYKPYRFTLNAYGGEYLEDGVIEVGGGRQIVLEIRSDKNTEEQRLRERFKDKYSMQNEDAYIFLQWEVDEGTDILREKLKECVNKAKR